MDKSASTDVAQDMHAYLLERHGPLMGGEALWRALGYSSVDAFRKAVQRKTIAVNTFSLPHHRGRFAKTTDVAQWLTGHAAHLGYVPDEKGGSIAG
jgi:hypothetical protein